MCQGPGYVLHKSLVLVAYCLEYKKGQYINIKFNHSRLLDFFLIYQYLTWMKKIFVPIQLEQDVMETKIIYKFHLQV